MIDEKNIDKVKVNEDKGRENTWIKSEKNVTWLKKKEEMKKTKEKKKEEKFTWQKSDNEKWKMLDVKKIIQAKVKWQKKKEEKRVKYIRERNLIKKEGKDERKISGQTLSRRGKNVEARKHFCRNKFN